MNTLIKVILFVIVVVVVKLLSASQAKFDYPYVSLKYENSTVIYLADNSWQEQDLTEERFRNYLNIAKQWDSTEVVFVGVLIPKRLVVYLVHSKDPAKTGEVEQKIRAAVQNGVTFQTDFNSFLQLIQNYPTNAFRYHIKIQD